MLHAHIYIHATKTYFCFCFCFFVLSYLIFCSPTSESIVAERIHYFLFFFFDRIHDVYPYFCISYFNILEILLFIKWNKYDMLRIGTLHYSLYMFIYIYIYTYNTYIRYTYVHMYEHDSLVNGKWYFFFF